MLLLIDSWSQLMRYGMDESNCHLYARVTTVSRPRNPAGAINKISPGLLQGGVFEEKQHKTAI